jgi:4-diphosphocytidyl-2-C-methyl-D-erythritol kinase
VAVPRPAPAGLAEAPVRLAEPAPAKVNLTLHVTGRRADGYHLLDSLVVFPRIGDTVAALPAEGLSLAIDGPFAAGLAAADNLVLRAARLMVRRGRGAAVTLTKRLPVAAGLGGGSSDAAAALRLLARLWGVPTPSMGELLSLGADVPVCLAARATRMSGIGEAQAPAALPACWLVLCNPGVPLATGAVFARLASAGNPPRPPIPRLADALALAGFLAPLRNDLETPALALAPAIGAALAALAAAPDCLLARMSGSGATCFGLFAAAGPAEAAAARIHAAEPDWWVAAAPVG